MGDLVAAIQADAGDKEWRGSMNPFEERSANLQGEAQDAVGSCSQIQRRLRLTNITLAIGLLLMLLLGALRMVAAQRCTDPVKNIVLVHGAWVDGSG